MTDIKERLRAGIGGRNPEAYMDADCLMTEAADYIERLEDALRIIIAQPYRVGGKGFESLKETARKALED